MTHVLIIEADAMLRQKMVEAFTQAGFSAVEAERAMRAFAQAMAPPKIVYVAGFGHGLSGLEAHVLARDEYYQCLEVNHPDGWYRKFYSEKLSAAAHHAKCPAWNRVYRTARARTSRTPY